MSGYRRVGGNLRTVRENIRINAPFNSLADNIIRRNWIRLFSLYVFNPRRLVKFPPGRSEMSEKSQIQYTAPLNYNVFPLRRSDLLNSNVFQLNLRMALL